MKKSANIIVRAVRGFIRDGGAIYSAALSYYFIFAVIPLCLFMLGAMGFLLGQDLEISEYVLGRVLDIFPSAAEGVASEIGKLVAYKGIALSSLILYGILSYQLYMGVHRSMQTVFKTTQKRHIVLMVILPLVVVSLVLGFMLLSFMLTSMVPLLQEYGDRLLPWLKLGAVTAVLLKYLVPLLVVQFAAIIVYVIVPVRKIRLDDAFWGGLFTAVMLEVAKHLFTWYVGRVSNLGAMYGSLAAFITFLLWVYYSWIIFLIGAEIVHELDESHKVNP